MTKKNGCSIETFKIYRFEHKMSSFRRERRIKFPDECVNGDNNEEKFNCLRIEESAEDP